jgi:hypothetical protein
VSEGSDRPQAAGGGFAVTITLRKDSQAGEMAESSSMGAGNV